LSAQVYMKLGNPAAALDDAARCAALDGAGAGGHRPWLRIEGEACLTVAFGGGGQGRRGRGQLELPPPGRPLSRLKS
jgi:hypothetical protein